MTFPQPEFASASSFLSSFLPPSPSTTLFSTTLSTLLQASYVPSHWYPLDPERGSAFRALIKSSVGSLDSKLLLACSRSGITPNALEHALQGKRGGTRLGDKWTMWIDPGCVCVRVESDGKVGAFRVVYGQLPVGLIKAREEQKEFVRSPSRMTISSSRDLPSMMDVLLSPTKRSSRAIQILPPPTLLRTSTSSTSANSMSSLRPTSPPPRVLQPILCASPFITPPTPLRPTSSTFSSARVESTTSADVFSPSLPLSTTSSSLFLPLSRAPSPSFSLSSKSSHSNSLSNNGDSYSTSESGGETDADAEDGVFSSCESVESAATSAHSNSHSHQLGDRKFIFPQNQQQQQQYLSTDRSFLPPHHSPNSPSKPRRRGTRGSGSLSSTSISSISSVAASASASVPATHRTREQALQGTLTEHSGGKVGVLGGGVLLGLAVGARALAGGEGRGRRGRRGAGGR